MPLFYFRSNCQSLPKVLKIIDSLSLSVQIEVDPQMASKCDLNWALSKRLIVTPISRAYLSTVTSLASLPGNVQTMPRVRRLAPEKGMNRLFENYYKQPILDPERLMVPSWEQKRLIVKRNLEQLLQVLRPPLLNYYPSELVSTRYQNNNVAEPENETDRNRHLEGFIPELEMKDRSGNDFNRVGDSNADKENDIFVTKNNDNESKNDFVRLPGSGPYRKQNNRKHTRKFQKPPINAFESSPEDIFYDDDFTNDDVFQDEACRFHNVNYTNLSHQKASRKRSKRSIMEDSVFHDIVDYYPKMLERLAALTSRNEPGGASNAVFDDHHITKLIQPNMLKKLKGSSGDQMTHNEIFPDSKSSIVNPTVALNQHIPDNETPLIGRIFHAWKDVAKSLKKALFAFK